MNKDRFLDEFDDMDMADGMSPDSRIIGIIDEMELAKDDFDHLDETKTQQGLAAMI